MNKTKQLKLGEKVVTVRKLPLGDYAEVFKSVQGFTKSLGNIDKISDEEMIRQFPVILAEAWPDAIKIIALASDLSEDEVAKEIGLDEAVDIFKAIYEVNNYSKLFDMLKKAMAQRAQKPKA